MPFAVSWILFAVPLVAAVFAWVGFCRHWSTEHHRFMRIFSPCICDGCSLISLQRFSIRAIRKTNSIPRL